MKRKVKEEAETSIKNVCALAACKSMCECVRVCVGSRQLWRRRDRIQKRTEFENSASEVCLHCATN